jgi:hypothetical protein
VKTKIETYNDAGREQYVFFIEERSFVTQRFSENFGRKPPSRHSVCKWHNTFVETGCFVRNDKKSGRPTMSDETVEIAGINFVHSPRKLMFHTK